MSSDDNHRRAHMTPTAVTFVHVPFSPPLLLILALLRMEGHYMLFSIEEFF